MKRLLNETHEAHLNRTSADAEAYEQLFLSDKNAAAQMAANTVLLGQLLDSLSHWHSKALSVANEWASRNRSIASERIGELWPLIVG